MESNNFINFRSSRDHRMQIHNREIFDQIVAYLEHHEHSVQIKKMLYCLCTDRWERDPDFLRSINCHHFAEYLVKEFDTHEELKEKLFGLLKTVNKPKEYIAVAKIIYSSLGQMYPDFHRMYSTTDLSAPARPAAVSLTIAVPEQPIEYNIFELRQNVMSYANPLRVKTLLLLMLVPTEFSDPRKIYDYLLDNLLANLISNYSKLPDIETAISEAVVQLPDVEEYGKAATGLIQALVPLYSKKTKPVAAVTV
jgi:hypothetical protein